MDADPNSRIGEIIRHRTGDESYTAYVPRPLPPSPALDLSEIFPLLDKASIALGRLDGMSLLLPDADLFLYMYVRKEAVLSSQIEGTQSSLSDLLLFENAAAPGLPIDDVNEVSSYVAAMNHGLMRLQEGFPLSLRLLREIHAILLSKGRGKMLSPGEFRTTQNWIGGTRPGNATFVPPPPDRLMECLGALETFLHEDKSVPVLVKAALAHLQFETIHPFLDGNGRLGRLLITFILCADGILKSPLLYLSLYFKTHRQQYYDHLQNVRYNGDWESWIQFFLRGIIDTADQATEAARKMLNLFNKDRVIIETTGSKAASMLRVHHALQRHPITDTAQAAQRCHLSLPATIKALRDLEKLEIVKEITGRSRGLIFTYTAYIDLLNQGTEIRNHNNFIIS